MLRQGALAFDRHKGLSESREELNDRRSDRSVTATTGEKLRKLCGHSRIRMNIDIIKTNKEMV